MNAMVDLVIRGAQVVSGSAIIDAAVAVDGERIVAVGEERLMPQDSSTVSYPGEPITADGAEMVVWVETHISQGAVAYPISRAAYWFNQRVLDGIERYLEQQQVSAVRELVGLARPA